jgi:16S rRNA (guanine966-N2)-methyltransferase
MRVISGTYKRRALFLDKKIEHIRPTSDRVKESLFNLIAARKDSFGTCLDLFCGSGALGIEALSRGAPFCVFVDSSPVSLTYLKKNLEYLKIPKSQYEIFEMEASRFLTRFGKTYQFDLVLVDPPYLDPWYNKGLHELDEHLNLTPHALLVIERGLKSPPLFTQEPLELNQLSYETTKKYGSTLLEVFYRTF